MKPILIAVLFVFIGGSIACTISMTNDSKPAEKPKSAENKSEPTVTQTKSDVNDYKPDMSDQKADVTNNKPSISKDLCLKAKMAGKKLIASQTFVFDYEPFPQSCFVTFASRDEMVDETDVPRGSTFHIYEPNNGIVYDFPDAFDEQSACWVEAVGFEDLNGDGKTEVIIAGRCLGAKDSYPQNAVYENHNDDFRTFPTQNENLNELKTVRQIIDYVKKHKSEFFDN